MLNIVNIFFNNLYLISINNFINNKELLFITKFFKVKEKNYLDETNMVCIQIV